MPARSDATTTPPKEGATVVTIDNKQIGTVTGYEANHFHVERRWGRGFWLTCNIIRSHEPGRTVLNISNETVPRYKRRLPPHRPMPVAQRPASRASHIDAARTRIENRWMLAFGAITVLMFGLLAAACEDDTPAGGESGDQTTPAQTSGAANGATLEAGDIDGAGEGNVGGDGQTLTLTASGIEPASLSIGAGTTITIESDVSVAHTVLVDGEARGEVAAGGSLDISLDDAGEYRISVDGAGSEAAVVIVS